MNIGQKRQNVNSQLSLSLSISLILGGHVTSKGQMKFEALNIFVEVIFMLLCTY